MDLPLLLAALCGIAAGCSRPPPELAVAHRYAVPPTGFHTLHVDAEGTFWLGGPGGLVRVDTADARVVGIALATADTAEIVESRDGLLLVRAGQMLLVLDASGDSITAEAPGAAAGPLAIDPRGRFILRALGAGEVVAHDPVSLEPLWGWADVGSPAGAIAFSPEGDRLYQTTVPTLAGLPPELLVRDVETGRILRRIELLDPIVALVVDREGRLYGLAGGGSEERLVALAWSGGSVDLVWTRPVPELGEGGAARLLVAPGGGTVALLAHQNAGLLVIDVETGRSVARYSGDALDVAFDSADRIFLLYPGELLRLESPGFSGPSAGPAIAIRQLRKGSG